MREPIARRSQEERGIALVVALLFLLVLTLIGISAVSTATFDNLISGNKRISAQAFYVAEAGINEFVGRFRPGATGEIIDNTQSDPNPDSKWRLFLARNSAGTFDIVDNVTEKPTRISYGSGTNDIFVPSYENLENLEDQMDYGVVARHKLDDPNKSSPNTIKKTMLPVYILTGHGRTVDGGNKVIEVEINKIRQDFGKPGALYSKSPVQIRGSSTYITGIDQCPQDGVYKNKAGVEVYCNDCPPPTIDDSTGNPEIFGDPPKIPASSNNIPLKEMLDYLKSDAIKDGLYYQYNKNTILTGSSPEESSWGYPIKSPTNPTETPLAYDGPMNIVYFNMNGDKTLKLAGDSHGAGILLVDGNLELSGGFNWYGVIIVTGYLDYTGGGQKNITGGVMAGESTTIEVDIGGNAGILNCSKAIDRLKEKIPPIKVTRWREIF